MPATETTTPARPRKSRAVREQEILDAAATLLTKEGVAALTMEGLAAQVGVNKALVYRYFGSRDHILAELWSRESGQLSADVAAAIEGAEPDLATVIEAVVQVWFDNLERNRVLSALEHLGARLPELASRQAQRDVDILGYVADRFRDGRQVSKRDAWIAASVLVSGASGLAQLWKATGWPRAQIVNAYVRLCLAAVDGYRTP